MPYIVFWISLKVPNLALKLIIWLNLDFFLNSNFFIFSVKYSLGKLNSLIMKSTNGNRTEKSRKLQKNLYF
jgi:hypothetical protein